MTTAYMEIAAIVISMALTMIGLSRWSAKRVADFADTERMQ